MKERPKCPICRRTMDNPPFCKRCCSDCHVEMTWKGNWGSDDEGRGGYDLMQCPKCKNIEVI